MFSLSILANIGGVKTLILIALAVIIALYLRVLSRREKKEAAAEPLTAARLAATPDDRLVDTVVRAMLADCDDAHPDPYRQTALWANAQVNVYSVWVVLKEQETGGFASLATSPSARFLPLAADGLAQLPAPQCEAVLRTLTAASATDETAWTAADAAWPTALAAEQPSALLVTYIRDNADAFVCDANA